MDYLLPTFGIIPSTNHQHHITRYHPHYHHPSLFTTHRSSVLTIQCKCSSAVPVSLLYASVDLYTYTPAHPMPIPMPSPNVIPHPIPHGPSIPIPIPGTRLPYCPVEYTHIYSQKATKKPPPPPPLPAQKLKEFQNEN